MDVYGFNNYVASIITPTPSGWTASNIAFAISNVNLSCTWSLLLKTSTILFITETIKIIFFIFNY